MQIPVATVVATVTVFIEKTSNFILLIIVIAVANSYIQDEGTQTEEEDEMHRACQKFPFVFVTVSERSIKISALNVTFVVKTATKMFNHMKRHVQISVEVITIL